MKSCRMRSKYVMYIAAVLSAGAATPAWGQSVPVKEDVGAECMPQEIAPIDAPFDMPDIARPTFPDYVVDITEEGARQGKSCTSAIQRAIDKVNAQGGGTVNVPAGEWLTGRITMKSNVNLHIASGAVLRFSGDIADYLPVVRTRNEGVDIYSLGAMIYADGAENIALTGGGRLVGPGRDCALYKSYKAHHIGSDAVDPDTPVEERIYDGQDGRTFFLPMFFGPINTRSVLVEGVTFENSVFWNITPQYCENVIIRGVTVTNEENGLNDGIDIDSSNGVLIEYCTLSCGDDCFTLKSGRGEDGVRAGKPSENIVIRHSLALRGAGGVTCGSETAGMIRNVYVHDCVFSGTSSGLRFKTRRPRGGGGENIHFERIRLCGVGTAFHWDMLGSRMYVGELADRLPPRPVGRLTPIYRDITFRDIVVESSNKLADLSGLPESPVMGILFDNVRAVSNELMRLRDVDGFVIANSTLSAQSDTITIVDSRNVMLVNTRLDVPGGEIDYDYTGELSRPVMSTTSRENKHGEEYADLNN